MRITVTARHCAIPDDLRRHARDLLGRLGRVAARAHRAQVTFADAHGEAEVEIRLHVPRGRIHVAKAAAADHRSALDRATARVRRQLLDRKAAPRPRGRPSRPVREPA